MEADRFVKGAPRSRLGREFQLSIGWRFHEVYLILFYFIFREAEAIDLEVADLLTGSSKCIGK